MASRSRPPRRILCLSPAGRFARLNLRQKPKSLNKRQPSSGAFCGFVRLLELKKPTMLEVGPMTTGPGFLSASAPAVTASPHNWPRRRSSCGKRTRSASLSNSLRMALLLLGSRPIWLSTILSTRTLACARSTASSLPPCCKTMAPSASPMVMTRLLACSATTCPTLQAWYRGSQRELRPRQPCACSGRHSAPFLSRMLPGSRFRNSLTCRWWISISPPVWMRPLSSRPC